jgi:hypothetical protein
MIQDLIDKIKNKDDDEKSNVSPGRDKVRHTISSVASLAAIALNLLPGEGVVPRLPDPAGRSDVTYDPSFKIQNRYEALSVDGIRNLLKRIGKLSGEVEAGEKFREQDNPYISNFYATKTVFPDNIFVCTFHAPEFDTTTPYTTPFTTSAYNSKGTALITPYHIKDVGFKILPSDIQSQKVLFVPFPTVDVTSIEYEFTVTFEEDSIGSVMMFLQWCYHRVIDMSYYHIPYNNRIGDFQVTIYNARYQTIEQHLFVDCFLKSAGDLKLDYSSSGVRTYTATFCAAYRITQTFNFSEILTAAVPGDDKIKEEAAAVFADEEKSKKDKKRDKGKK